jgi:hypothetical protein
MPVRRNVDPAGVLSGSRQHRAGDKVAVASRSVANSAGTTCAPRKVVSEVKSDAIRSARTSSAILSPHRSLISIVVALEPGLGHRAARSAVRLASSVSRVAANREPDPAAVVAPARHPGREFLTASPANTRWLCESTNPG